MLAGLALGFRAGAVVGLATLVTELLGRPAVAALSAVTEILTYGLVAGLAGQHARTSLDRWVGLVAAIVAGRVVYAIMALIAVSRPLGVSFERAVVGPWRASRC